MNQPIIQLLLTGNEVMSGDTVDSNSATIAQRLGEVGLGVWRKVTVGDDTDLLCKELLDQSAHADVLIVNGGLGPTVDDLTADALARAAGVPLEEHAGARAHIEAWCERLGLTDKGAVSAANLKQALLPRGCEIIDNPVGSAVGFCMPLGDCLVICTPGVPSELRPMLDAVLGVMQAKLGPFRGGNVLRLQTFGLGEASTQQMIADAKLPWPEGVELGFRAGAPQMEVKLSITDPALAPAQQTCRQWLEELFGDHIIGTGDATLAARVLTLLTERGQTITTAESCTGGRIASELTRVPGASAAFQAGYVTYSNTVKHKTLGVSLETLARHGAVSEEVVVEMAEGALAAAGADYAIAVSGVAGPGGGSADKPVGSVWLAWGRAGDIRTRGLRWRVGRDLFQTMLAGAGLDMIRRMLLGLDSEPRYFFQRGRTVNSQK